MKIETNDYMTVPEAMAAVDCSRRSLYRAMQRAVEAGATVYATVLGRRVILRSALPAIKANYFPFGSDERSAMAKVWGATGGATKAANRLKQSRRRSS